MPRVAFTSTRAALSLGQGSLRWRISWLLAGMALAIVAVFGLFAYRTARATTLTAAHARLRSALAQMNTLAELGVVNQLDNLRTIARDPRVIDALQHPDVAPSDAARASLRRLQGAGTATIVELLGADGAVLYSSEAAPAKIAGRPAFEFPVEGGIGPIFESGDVQMFDAGAAVVDAGQRIGSVRLTRRLGRGANRRIIAGLLGENAALLIGNRGGDMWGDSGRLSYPLHTSAPLTYEHDGRAWVSVSEVVRGTPWLYAVEIPEHDALAPARALLTPFLLSGLVIALGAALIGLVAGRRITSPLVDLTKAAEAMARGDRTVDLAPTRRQDEIGRLAQAFGTMASSVRAVQDRLEAEVDTRSGELTRAVERLRSLDGELQRNERFATLGRMSGSVGHELRNPLGVMSTVVFLLDALPDASPKLKDYAALLREQIRLSERIISDVLDRARSSAPVRTSTDVAAFLDDLILRAEIPASVRIERHVAASMPLVLLDRDRVGQVVWNLVSNAVQAMQGAGTLTLTAAIADDELRVSVCDSGPGIAMDDHERIFEPLFTTKPEGVGLGLSISRAYARSIGGDLSIAPTDGYGACFVFELPIHATPDGDAVATMAETRQAAS